MDIELENLPATASSAELTRAAYKALVKAVAGTIGSQLSGLLVGENATLYKEAVANGEREIDFFGKITRLLISLSGSFTDVDFSKLLPTFQSQDRAHLEEAIKSNIDKTFGAFYVFIDDTDQIGSPGTKDHLNRIWSLLLAARELSSRIDRVRVVITLRDEIWRALGTESSSQWDQWDHFLRLVFSLNPDLDHVQKIFERRLTLAAASCGAIDELPHYDYFFEGNNPRMPTSTKRSSWPDIIRTRSRERPRDAIQLINMLATEALKPPECLINEDILNQVMPIYSKERASLLSQEFEKECPALKDVIRSFAKIEFDEGSFTASCESIRAHLTSISSLFSLTLSGRLLTTTVEADVFQLWGFLFSIGLLYPRVSDARESEGYRFVVPGDDPSFVSKSRWNEMQKSLWEVHPCFRDYLIAVSRDEAAQFGLPRKAKPKRR